MSVALQNSKPPDRLIIIIVLMMALLFIAKLCSAQPIFVTYTKTVFIEQQQIVDTHVDVVIGVDTLYFGDVKYIICGRSYKISGDMVVDVLFSSGKLHFYFYFTRRLLVISNGWKDSRRIWVYLE